MYKNLTAIVLIMIVLLSPVACFAHPCIASHAVSTTEIQLQLASSEQCPIQHEVDFCETSCCCADYVQLLPFPGVAYSPDITRNHIHPRIAYLPKVPDRIFVPPQNRYLSA